MKEMKDMMLQQNETVLQREIARAASETVEIERSLQQLSVGVSTKLSKESEQSRQELLEEIREQHPSNDAFRKMCEDALSKTVYERTGQKIKGVKATNYSSVLAGFINTSGEESKINQDISDVIADNWSVAITGVIKNVDFKDLRLSRPPNNNDHSEL
jgi:vacuolar-type H+-ATPase subunit E/Vma4